MIARHVVEQPDHAIGAAFGLEVSGRRMSTMSKVIATPNMASARASSRVLEMESR